MFALAAPPTRAHTSVTLAAGMVNIPLSVFTSTEATRVARKEFLNGDPSVEIGRSPIRKDTGEVVLQSDVTRMAEADNGSWVILTDDEIAACTSDKNVAEVISFVPVKDIDSYLTEGLYQVRPKVEKGKANPAAVKALSILFAGMKARKVGALIKVAMRGPARYAILTTEGELRLILTADAVREARDLPAVTVAKNEVALATSLIDAIGIDTPVITDDTAPVVKAYVNSKAGGAPTKAVAQPPATNNDLVEAFQASIDAAVAAKGRKQKVSA